jgi:tetratricopeptide (TPR) repeat protein
MFYMELSQNKAMSFYDVRETLKTRIPLKAVPHEVVDTQRSSFNEGLQFFHAEEYHQAIELFQKANAVQQNNLILFALSLTYYIVAEFETARTYADQIDSSYFGHELTPDASDLEYLYYLINGIPALPNGEPPKIYMPPDLSLLHIFGVTKLKMFKPENQRKY